jgi:large subunit ribosomal protein L15
MAQLAKPQGSSTRKKVVGRGNASGKGRTSTRGHKGSKARAGGTIKLGFEGGQLSLIRRLPKFGFKNEPHRVKYESLNVDAVDRLVERLSLASEEITPALLNRHHIVPKGTRLVKLIGPRRKAGALKNKLTIGDGVLLTATAREMITAAGGTVVQSTGTEKPDAQA